MQKWVTQISGGARTKLKSSKSAAKRRCKFAKISPIGASFWREVLVRGKTCRVASFMSRRPPKQGVSEAEASETTMFQGDRRTNLFRTKSVLFVRSYPRKTAALSAGSVQPSGAATAPPNTHVFAVPTEKAAGACERLTNTVARCFPCVRS